MTVLYLILPLALLLAAGAVAAFAWAVRSGQLDDVDTPPRRVLFDDELATPRGAGADAKVLHARAPLARDLRSLANHSDPGLARKLRGQADMDAQTVRTILLTQHDRIRRGLDLCTFLAERLRRGEPVEVDLDLALTQLRAEINEHNSTETALVGPLLHDSPGWGIVLVDRMLEEHIAEHAVFWEMLSGSPGEVAARMPDLVEDLEAHMAAEERTFLSPLVLRDDVISRHRASGITEPAR